MSAVKQTSSTISAANQIKQDRENKYRKMHEDLVKSLKILTTMQRPREEFYKVFNDTMFLTKNNYEAFQEITYYLLGLLAGKDLKKYVNSWPICDKKMADQYRREVLIYVNREYQKVNLSPIQMHVLLSPSGHKFVNFIYKLTAYVTGVIARRIDADKENHSVQELDLKNESLMKENKDLIAKCNSLREERNINRIAMIGKIKQAEIEVKELEDYSSTLNRPNVEQLTAELNEDMERIENFSVTLNSLKRYKERLENKETVIGVESESSTLKDLYFEQFKRLNLSHLDGFDVEATAQEVEGVRSDLTKLNEDYTKLIYSFIMSDTYEELSKN